MASKEEIKEAEEKPKPSEEEEPKEGQEEEKEAKEPPKEGEEEEAAAAAAETTEAPAAAAATSSDMPDDEAEGGDRGKRVYVGNLAWQVSWQDLKDHMKSTGLEVTRANIITAPDGRSKGCGIVEFATSKDAAQAVLTLNDTELKGRQIFVREDREDRPSFAGSFSGGGGFSSGEQAQSRRVYVGNLSWDVAWQDLKDHMKQAGEVAHAEIITDQHSGRSKGCGVVEFASEEEAQQAIETLSNTELKGRSIFVREDRESTSKAGGGGGGSGGRSANPSVYVWNLSVDTSWQDLKDHMRRAGNVDSASVFVSPSGETCSGIVVYQRPQDAARAIRELQGTELHGMAMNLREDRMHSSGRGGQGRGGSGRGRGYGGRGYGRGDRGDPNLQVFVSNLSYDTTWRELKDHFRQCGDVKRAEVKTTSSGESRGFGIVSFYNKEDAEAAVSTLSGSELQGREIEVRPDNKAH